MTYRILQHEKNTDQIRIGRVFEDASGVESSVKAITHALATYHEITPEEFGKYWSRIAIVDADTLAVIATVYSEEKSGRCASDRRRESLDEIDNLLDSLTNLFEAEQRAIGRRSAELTEDIPDEGTFLWKNLQYLHKNPQIAARDLSRPLSDPCTQLAGLVGTLCGSTFPLAHTLRGLSASLVQDKSLRFCISGEVSLSDLQKLCECHISGGSVSERN